MRPGDWSKQAPAQTKIDKNIVKRHLLCMIGVQMHIDELMHVLGVYVG